MKLAASAEFVSSPAALPKFQEVYGFTLKPEQLVTLSGGDTAATIAAAAQQTNGVNAAMVYGTDGGIAPSGLTVMADDKGVQPVYEPAPIIREAVLQANPQIDGPARAGVCQARPGDAAGAQRPHPGRWRGRQGRRRRLAEDQRLPEVSRQGGAGSWPAPDLMSVDAQPQPITVFARIDRLGVVIALLVIVGAIAPFVSFRANRIVSGEGARLADGGVAGDGRRWVVATVPRRIAVDKLGVLIAVLAAIAAVLPFAAFRANRIVLGEAKGIFAALPGFEAAVLALVLVAGIALALLRTPTLWRLGGSLAVLALLFVAVGHAGTFHAGGRQARAAPRRALGFWLLILAFALLAADACRG